MSTESSAAAPARRPRALLLVMSLLCVVSVITAGFYGASWVMAANGADVTRAKQRDEALRVGSQAFVNLNSIDHQKIDPGLDLWEQSATGQLLEGLKRDRKATAEEIKKAKVTSNATVLDAAVTQLNEQAGKAQIAAVLKVTIKSGNQQPLEQRARYQAEMVRKQDEWKLSVIKPISSQN